MITTFDNNFQDLQKDFDNITRMHSSHMSNIASSIRFNPNMTDEIKDQLIEFAAEQERLANHQSISERFMRKVSTIPLIGKAAKQSAESIRKQRLQEESVSGLVKSMYDGLRAQASDVEQTETQLIKIYEQTKINIELMQELEEKISTLVQTNEIPITHKSRIMRMKTQIKVMIEKSKDKLESLEIIIPTTQACLEMIYQDLPISEADLLSDMAMSTGVAQINALSQDVKEMRELSDLVSTNIWSRTQKSIINLLEINTISDKDIARIQHNTQERENLRLETMKAAQQSSQQIQQAYQKIETLAIESQTRRSQYALEHAATF